jgi:hypothetical protein
MLAAEDIKLIGTVLGMLVGAGTVVVGVVQAIGNSKDQAVKIATEAIKVVVGDLDALGTKEEADKVAILTRLNEIDLWRKDINGQLKLIGAHMEFSNTVANEQKNVMASLVASTQQIAVSVAGIQSVCNFRKGCEA